MGRKPKFDFDSVFGEFDAVGANEKPNKLYVIEDSKKVHRCNKCGGMPRVHDIAFLSRDPNKKHFYIDCDCCNDCDGEMYLTEQDVIDAWNKAHPFEEVPIDEAVHERNKFLKDMVDNIRIV